jgi:predicted nucleic acid-binding protein
MIDDALLPGCRPYHLSDRTKPTVRHCYSQHFDDYFANTIAEIFPLTRDVVDLATELRAQYNFKTPDSLHLAAAVISNCDVFMTNDQRLNRYTGIIIETI